MLALRIAEANSETPWLWKQVWTHTAHEYPLMRSDAQWSEGRQRRGTHDDAEDLAERNKFRVSDAVGCESDHESHQFHAKGIDRRKDAV